MNLICKFWFDLNLKFQMTSDKMHTEGVTSVSSVINECLFKKNNSRKIFVSFTEGVTFFSVNGLID